MKSILLLIVVIIMMGLYPCHSQYVIPNSQEARIYAELPQEKVYLDHTGNVVFSGEYLYYSFYCINTQTSKFSTFSEIGYVVLVNKDLQYVIEQKIPLESGLGQGEIFVNTEIPSGNYKLLAYTQWMKNSGLEQIYSADVAIVNPYKNNQDEILGVEDLANDNTVPTFKADIKSPTFFIKLEKRKFLPREPVRMELLNYAGRLGYGKYTIKVQKIDEFTNAQSMSAIDFGERYAKVDKVSAKSVGDSIFLPEQDGELIFGKAYLSRDSEPLRNKPIVISFPGNDFALKFANTDNRGIFYTYIQDNLRDKEMVLQALDTPGAEIKVMEQPKLKLETLKFGDFQLNPQDFEKLRIRSIHNQIENQFYSHKPDSVIIYKPVDLMMGGTPTIIKLDDYTRFPTLKETILENVLQAGFRKGPDGKEFIRILQAQERPGDNINNYPALVLVDGVFIPNHKLIGNLNAFKIEAIEIIDKEFSLANEIYHGIIAIKTFDRNYFDEYDTDYGVKISKEVPLPKKKYYKQRYYSSTTDSHIPDYRRILYWEPHMEIKENSITIEFFTSDLRGKYRITLNGFTSYGKPITVSTTFEVGDQNN